MVDPWGLYGRCLEYNHSVLSMYIPPPIQVTFHTKIAKSTKRATISPNDPFYQFVATYTGSPEPVPPQCLPFPPASAKGIRVSLLRGHPYQSLRRNAQHPEGQIPSRITIAREKCNPLSNPPGNTQPTAQLSPPSTIHASTLAAPHSPIPHLRHHRARLPVRIAQTIPPAPTPPPEPISSCIRPPRPRQPRERMMVRLRVPHLLRLRLARRIPRLEIDRVRVTRLAHIPPPAPPALLPPVRRRRRRLRVRMRARRPFGWRGGVGARGAGGVARARVGRGGAGRWLRFVRVDGEGGVGARVVGEVAAGFVLRERVRRRGGGFRGRRGAVVVVGAVGFAVQAADFGRFLVAVGAHVVVVAVLLHLDFLLLPLLLRLGFLPALPLAAGFLAVLAHFLARLRLVVRPSRLEIVHDAPTA